jgi:Tol biopolymer transport system component
MHPMRTILLVAVASLLAALPLASPASAAPTDQVAFERDGDIWVMNADGTGEVNLTNHPAIDAHPDWSPDGTRIAFISNRADVAQNEDGNLEVFVMNADGTEVTQVTDSVYPFPGQSGYDHYYPSWSPDGTQLAFEWNSPYGSREIYVINLDGTDERLVTDRSDFASKMHPDWSPVGNQIAFTWGFGYLVAEDVYVINADGTGQQNLTPDTVNWTDFDPAWSPDGTRIAFVTTRNPGEMGLPNEDVYVMNADGTGLLQLTDCTCYDNEPSWSPDGTQVTFTSNRSGAWDLWTVDVPAAPRGSVGTAALSGPVPPAHQLTDTAAAEANSAWKPSGTVPLVTLTVGVRGPGGIVSKPRGIRCGTDCAEAFVSGTAVTLKAVPKPGAVFVGWTGACTGMSVTCTVQVGGGMRAGARFTTAS